MKEMKKVIINTVWILSLGLFAGCADIINSPPSVSPETSAGKGLAVVTIDPRLDGERTFMPTEPSSEYYEDLSYTLEFTAKDRAPVSGSISGGTGSVELEAGTWDLKVTGKDEDDTEILEGRVTGIVITAELTTNVPVTLAAFTEYGTGTLSYSVSLPVGVIKGTLTVYNWDGEIAKETVDLLSTPDGNTERLAGYYRIALDLYKADGVFHRTDIAHIYPGLTTEAAYTIVDGDFVGVGTIVDAGETSLASVLAGISGLSSGADKLYLLPAGEEPMVATSVSNTSGPVTVTIDGGGRNVTLGGTGALITVGSNVTLVLRNIILWGQGSGSEDPANNAVLVAVQSGGMLELRTGVCITGNKNSYGGGVSVDGYGTFTMSGGEISANTASYYGGGVSVYANGTFVMSGGKIMSNSGAGVYVGSNGTFTLDGGEILGNSSTSYDGGGVYVNDNGNFIMNGGKILDNTASFYGGGVFAGGTFTMNGGDISGNTAFNGGGVRVVYTSTVIMNGGVISGNKASGGSGGGMYVSSAGASTMNNGEISGNTASSCGGGVFIDFGGIFTMGNGAISGNKANQGGGVYATGYPEHSGVATLIMNDGEISGNMAIDGGGVYFGYNGAFTMSYGKISDNTAFYDGNHYGGLYGGYGGGVFIEDNGTFTMSGGQIHRNTASSYGAGVYVDYPGILTMSGGARISPNDAVCLDYASYGSNHSFVTIGGDFSAVPGGPVATLDFYGFSSSTLSASNGAVVLKLADGYSGNLAALKDRFTPGNLIYYTGSVEPTGYIIRDDGTLQASSIGIAGISHTIVMGSDEWTQSSGRRQSPAIDHNGVTKSHVSFTATQANASIRIQLEVSSELNYDWAFISTLNNANATSSGGYYTGSRISGTNSVTVTIPVPTAGSYFVDIGYQKDSVQTGGSDCAWYRVLY
jgi:hypothetical protein